MLLISTGSAEDGHSEPRQAEAQRREDVDQRGLHRWARCFLANLPAHRARDFHYPWALSAVSLMPCMHAFENLSLELRALRTGRICSICMNLTVSNALHSSDFIPWCISWRNSGRVRSSSQVSSFRLLQRMCVGRSRIFVLCVMLRAANVLIHFCLCFAEVIKKKINDFCSK